VRRALGTVAEVVRARPRRFARLWLAAALAYQLFLLAPFAAFGAPPNYLRVYDAWGGVVESIRLRPPWAALLELVADQPVYEFGVRDRLGFVPLQYVATVHGLVTMLLLPLLVALAAGLVARAWSLPAAGRRRPLARGAALGSGGTLLGLLGAATSAAACCGASSGPVVLGLLGIGAGTAGAVVERAEWLEAAGFAVLVVDVLVLAGWIGARPAAACAGNAAGAGKGGEG